MRTPTNIKRTGSRKRVGLGLPLTVLVALVAALATLVLALASPAPASTPTGELDANNLPGDYPGWSWATTGQVPPQELAQTFTALKSGNLTSAQAMAGYDNWGTNGPRSDIVMQIAAVDAEGHPGNILATTQIPADQVPDVPWFIGNPNNATLLTGTFSDPPQVTAGERYALILVQPAGTPSEVHNGWVWSDIFHNTEQPQYADGAMWFRNNAVPTGWLTAGTPQDDFIFAVYVTPSQQYDFSGFFAPVDNPGPENNVYNTVKAGSAIPVKFSLAGDQGLDIFYAGYPASRQIPKVAGVDTDAIEQTVTAGNSGLSYNQLTGQYTYVWKTEKSWAKSDRELILKLADGTEHTALFRFTK